jgi:asparagine N-glycosylation enzyme membrane subunit Stt3
MPAAFATAAVVAAVALVLRAHTGTAMPAPHRPESQPAGPYRAGGPATIADRSDSFDPIELPVALSPGAAARLEVGALFSLFLAAVTRWPNEHLVLGILFVGLTVALFVWRRSAFAFVPVAMCGAQVVVARHVVPIPETTLGWGKAALTLGFLLLAVALAATSWITLRSRGEPER